MANSKYWQERFDQIEQAANNKSVRYASKLEKKYKVAAEELDAQINKWYNRIAKNNEVSITEARRLLTASELKEFKWTVEEYIKFGRENAVDQQWVKELENASAKFHINRLEAMKMECRQQIERAVANGQQDMFDVLRDVYRDTFYHSCYEVQKGVGVGFDIAKLDDTTVSRLLNKPWAADGTNFSRKIWSNKTKLINRLDEELSRMVLTGDTPKRAIHNIKEAMNSSLFQAKRLVLTEQAFFTSEAQKKCFNDLDVDEFEVLSSMDRRVCPICAENDKKHHPMVAFHVGITAPPFHPLCRCVTAPYFDDEFTRKNTRVGKNVQTGETNHFPANMSYKEWYDRFVRTSLESKKAIKKATGKLPFGDEIDKNVIKVEEFKKQFAAGNISKHLKKQKQAEHIEGTKQRSNRIARDKEQEKTPSSYFYENTDVEALFEKYACTGTIVFLPKQKFPTEYVFVDKAYGKVYNLGKKMYVETKKVAIKYSSKGYHIFPVKER